MSGSDSGDTMQSATGGVECDGDGGRWTENNKAKYIINTAGCEKPHARNISLSLCRSEIRTKKTIALSHYPRARARIRFIVVFFARGVPGIFASFLFYLVKNTREVAAVAGKKSVVFEEFAYFYATIKL